MCVHLPYEEPALVCPLLNAFVHRDAHAAILQRNPRVPLAEVRDLARLHVELEILQSIEMPHVARVTLVLGLWLDNRLSYNTIPGSHARHFTGYKMESSAK